MNRQPILFTVLLLAAPILAQRRASGDVWSYLAKKYDKNGDGKISLQEYGRSTDKFAAYDRNSDGKISPNDFSGGGRRRGARRAGQRGGQRNNPANDIAVVIAKNADDNEDGKVTHIEWGKALATLDHDQDRIVSPEELNGIMCAALGRKKLSNRTVGRRSHHLDTNKDGKVQLAELAGMFTKIDKNRDQILSSTELGSARSLQRPSGPPRVGEMAPDFDLPYVKTPTKTAKLSSFRGKKPVALIFGSYT